MIRLRRIFDLRKLTVLFIATSALALVPVGNASAGIPLKCSPWGSVGYAANDIQACIGVHGRTIFGRGNLKPGGETETSKVPMWIEVHRLESLKNYQTHIGNTIEVPGLPNGRYEIVFYRNDFGGAQSSPVVTINAS